MVFFKWGFETQPDCIANIRHIRQFQYWAAKVIRGRELIDEQVMNMFYTMAGIQTSGNKITMQGFRDTDGLLKLMPSADPRNPLRGGLFNYMEERFPSPTNLNNIVPLTVDSLEGIARYWAQFPKNNEVARGPRGESIYEFWYPDDWYQAEAIRNPDYMDKLKLLMPNKLFSGTTLAPGDREVIGNWAAKVMPWLPRYAPTSDGRIVAVDTHVGVDIEVGKEYVGSIDFENAPFGLAVIASGKQGTILTRPPLTQSGAGFPIQPITGDGPWIIRNEYDKVCNKDRNKPWSQKDYEMGVRMDDPAASMSFLFRRRIFPMRPINECDLAPIFNVDSNEVDCTLTVIGCQDNKRRVSDDITQNPDAPMYVTCAAQACGDDNSSPYHYMIKVDRRSNQPGYNSLGCTCGAAVKLYVYDEDGVFVKEIDGVYMSDSMSFPYARYFIETTVKLAAGECIKGIKCADSTRLQGNVNEAWDGGEGVVEFLLDDSIVCGEGDDVKVTYYDADGNVLGVIAGEIVDYDPTRFYYKISSVNPAFQAENAYTGQASIGVSCNQSPNASSSTSGV